MPLGHTKVSPVRASPNEGSRKKAAQTHSLAAMDRSVQTCPGGRLPEALAPLFLPHEYSVLVSDLGPAAQLYLAGYGYQAMRVTDVTGPSVARPGRSVKKAGRSISHNHPLRCAVPSPPELG